MLGITGLALGDLLDVGFEHRNIDFAGLELLHARNHQAVNQASRARLFSYE